ncbi:hypothetical protein [Streptomyces sp. NPDC091212]|uniref:hypothetical protein n=1 Tax=Streptomyces sp. NPDC091212 TaxID=3155191 RepID=UPI0034448BE7
MPDGELTEREALALWCDQLPSLREMAARTGATARLERDIGRVRDSGSALRACRKWLPDDVSGATRSWSGESGTPFVALPGRQEVRRTGVGAYVCPTDACTRRSGRDPQGHPPTCAVLGTAMRVVG